MKEREALAYVKQAGSRGIVPGLESVRELCRRLGNPQAGLKIVHVAGTNGKGSVSAYIASVLKCGGYRVGRYISPAIFDYREIIQTDEHPITKKAFCQGMELIREACEAMEADGLGHPTAFEMETALGFWYFQEKKCDIVVLETGMGGLLDATNLAEGTLAAVITSVSRDHMKFLGDTLGEIAGQKAGIIKAGCHVVTGFQEQEVLDVVAEKAALLGCPLIQVGPEELSHVRYGLEKQRFDYGDRKGVEISLAGKHQVENAAVALEALDVLAERGFPVAEEKIRQGMLQARWPGRFTLVGRRPYFIVDGAHNEDAARRLEQSLKFYFQGRRMIFIMGVLRDKEYGQMIQITHALADQIITVTPPENARALSAYDLAREVSALHPGVTAADSLEEAVEMSRLLAGKEGVIVAFGSLSFLGRLMEIVRKKETART